MAAPPLISNCGPQGRSWRLESCPQETGDKKSSAWEPHRAPPPPPVSESTFLALPTSYWGNVEIVIMTGAFDGGYQDAFKGRWATVCHAGAVQNCEGLGVVQPLSGVRLFATPWTAA